MFFMLEIILSTFLNLQPAKVSWYECCNRRTASGMHFNPDKLFVAHRTLPFGTKVLFVNGNKSAVAEVQDRGPFIRGREFDLSRGLAKVLNVKDSGVANVKYAIL